MDRMRTGEKLGYCPTCGGDRWWDNRARKTTGEMDRNEPDYACADCRHGRSGVIGPHVTERSG